MNILHTDLCINGIQINTLEAKTVIQIAFKYHTLNSSYSMFLLPKEVADLQNT